MIVMGAKQNRPARKGRESEMDNELDVGAGATMFVPPWALIMKRVGDGPAPGTAGGPAGQDDVVLPRGLLQFLLRCLLEHTDFDERQYRECNPDVAEAVNQRIFASGRDHFISIGYFEGRMGGTSVHEVWYLARNPDVAAAKQSGAVESGEMQYRMAGVREWREPNPEAVKWIAAWKEVLEHD